MRDCPTFRTLLPLLAGFLFLCLTVTPVSAQQVTPLTLITVQGEASVQMKPDVARFIVSVRTEGKDVATVVAGNANRADAVLKALKDAGVAEKDLRTSSYNLYPNYEPPTPGKPTTSKIIGYIVDNSLLVTVRRIADAGKLLDVATKAGANSAGSLSFTLSEESEEKARNEALTAAVKKAKDKAVVIAKAAKAGAIFLHNITEGGASYPSPPMRVPMMAEGRMASATPISPGELTVTVSVTLQYRFNPDTAPNYD